MRLRQIALASRNLDGLQTQLEHVLGLKVAYRDPGVGHYGLRNIVMPLGQSFLEIVEPIQEGTSAGRFIDRMGGSAGYMVILQGPDAPAASAMAVEHGAREVDRIDRRDYFAVHFHPASFGGVLVSFDQQRSTPDPYEPFGDWMPAGPDWREAITPQVTQLLSVDIATAEPLGLAERWAELMGQSISAADPSVLTLDMGAIRFRATQGSRTTVSCLELAVVDPAAMLERARQAGLPVQDNGFDLGGVRFELVTE
jgi:hypothetical protein